VCGTGRKSDSPEAAVNPIEILEFKRHGFTGHGVESLKVVETGPSSGEVAEEFNP
jgi:hypothetical protein